MSSNEFSPGLAGVVAFETEIAEPDKEGGSLRYRGVDIEEINFPPHTYQMAGHDRQVAGGSE